MLHRALEADREEHEVAIHPSGAYLYLANYFDEVIEPYAIDGFGKTSPLAPTYGTTTDATEFRARAESWKNLFDADGTRTEVMEPITVDGVPAKSSDAPPPHAGTRQEAELQNELPARGTLLRASAPPPTR